MDNPQSSSPGSQPLSPPSQEPRPHPGPLPFGRGKRHSGLWQRLPEPEELLRAGG